MLLLLQISRTRPGAASILDAGFMAAVRDSLLFRADPDLGFSLPASADGTNINLPTSNTNNPTTAAALQNYYTLLAPTLRVLLSLFTSRGAQNEQGIFLVRSFLSEYRANMVGVFKKFRGVSGKVDARSEAKLGEVVRCYTGLCVLSGWVEWEDESFGGGDGGNSNGNYGNGGMEGVRSGGVGNGMGSVRDGKGFS